MFLPLDSYTLVDVCTGLSVKHASSVRAGAALCQQLCCSGQELTAFAISLVSSKQKTGGRHGSRTKGWDSLTCSKAVTEHCCNQLLLALLAHVLYRALLQPAAAGSALYSEITSASCGAAADRRSRYIQ